jgi:hypothetical protein
MFELSLKQFSNQILGNQFTQDEWFYMHIDRRLQQNMPAGHVGF